MAFYQSKNYSLIFGGDDRRSSGTGKILSDTWTLGFGAPTTTKLASAPNPSSYGQQVIFTAVVTASRKSGPCNPGQTPDPPQPPLPVKCNQREPVVFKDGDNILGTAPVQNSTTLPGQGEINGTATFSTDALLPGTHTITATYAGSKYYDESGSAKLIQTVLDTGLPVNRPPVNRPQARLLSLSPDSGPIAGGQEVTIKGSGLLGATAVQFGGKSVTKQPCIGQGTGTAPCFTTNPAGNEIVVFTPSSSAAGPVDVTVAAPVGGPTNALRYTYVDPDQIMKKDKGVDDGAVGSGGFQSNPGTVLGAPPGGTGSGGSGSTASVSSHAPSLSSSLGSAPNPGSAPAPGSVPNPVSVSAPGSAPVVTPGFVPVPGVGTSTPAVGGMPERSANPEAAPSASNTSYLMVGTDQAQRTIAFGLGSASLAIFGCAARAVARRKEKKGPRLAFKGAY